MNRLSVVFVASLALVACNQGGSVGSLTLITPVTADSTCPAGGARVQTGPDKNGNGTLDADEVTQTQEICNGTPGTTGPTGPGGDAGVNALVNSTALPAGDANCPNGGSKLDFGLDNGANGGTAGDGVLQPGEILSTRYVCNGSLPYFPDDVTPPAMPAGQYTIDARGGAGVNGGGANGGSVGVSMSSGSLGGAVKVFSTGAVDAGFSVPTPPTFNAGSTPMTVSADLTLTPYADVTTGLASNDAFFRTDFDSVIWANQAGVAVEVSSLTVAAGKTLTLSAGTQRSVVDLVMRGDVKNDGTIATSALVSGLGMAGLNVSCSNYLGAVGSSLVTRGADTTDGGSVGGVGGTLNLFAGALVINQGRIDASGGSGDTGGAAGSISLNSNDGAIYNTGAVSANGGPGLVTSGGSASAVTLHGSLGVSNSGALSSNGGDGPGSGGRGMQVSVENVTGGQMKNAGPLSATGGSCTVSGCLAGNGGTVTLNARSAELFHNATITTSGGNGGDQGGSGGSINITGVQGSGPFEGVFLSAGSMHVSGNMVCHGGQGSQSGAGGAVQVTLSPASLPLGQFVELLGYTSFDVSGGAGDNQPGGTGGYVQLYTSPSYPPYGESAGGAPSGPVVFYPNVTGKGGDGSQGGVGANVTLYTQRSWDFHQPREFVANYGNVDVSAGLSTINAGTTGGSVTIEGVSGVTNHGTLTAKGGATSGGPLLAGQGGAVQLWSDDGPVTNSAVIDVHGGAGSGNGGSGGTVQCLGSPVTNTATITASGGNATAAGGGGGQVTISSTPVGPSVNTGALSAAGGTGTPAGLKGVVLLDGVDVTN